MGKNKGKEKVNDTLLDKVAGGWDGEYKFISSYDCPSCGKETAMRLRLAILRFSAVAAVCSLCNTMIPGRRIILSGLASFIK